MNLKSAATSELMGLGTSILRGNNPSSSIFVPSLPGLSNSLGAIATNVGGGFGGISSGGGGSAGLIAGASLLGASMMNKPVRLSNQEVTDATASINGAPQSSTSFLDPAQRAQRAATTGAETSESSMNTFIDPAQRAQRAASTSSTNPMARDPAQQQGQT